MAHARRIVLFDRVTADGYFAGPDGNLNWVVPDADFDRGVGQSIEQDGADTLLFGRRTYQQFESFWPGVLGDSGVAPDPHHPGRKSPEMHAMAVMINDATKLVFSRTLKNVTWKNSRLLHELDPSKIEALKRQPGKDMMIFGSGSIVAQLTEHGLIDEYQLFVSPVFLGSGKPLLSGVPKSTRLRLLESKAYPSGNVMLRYERAGS